MLYAIYDPNGQIIQANKVWHAVNADQAYEDNIRALGQNFVKKDSASVLSPELYYVDVTAQALIDRPVMPVNVSAAAIKVNSETTMLTGIPTGSAFRILAGTTEYQTGTMDSDGTEIEFSAPVIGTYSIILGKWPFQTRTVTIEVHA